MAEDEPIRQGPSLRIATLAITNFRSFRARTVLPFADGAAEPDAIVTLHGDNGAGKSNAIAALDEFFLALTLCLEQGDEKGELLLAWDGQVTVAARQLVVASRDRPAGADGPTDIEVGFHDRRLGTIRTRFIPSGRKVRLRVEHRPAEPAALNVEQDGFVPFDREDRDQLLTWLETPRGTKSRPLAIVDERRRPVWLPRVNNGSLLHPALAEALFAVRTELNPEAREAWRTFGETLQRFPQFRGKVIEIQRTKPEEPPEVIVEEPRRTVLRLDELSSGEQQVVVLYATVALAAAPIVAISEPELSLDHKNQETFGALIKELVKAGQIDQILIESHVPAFDGEQVLRFRRSADGSTAVERGPSVGPKEREIRAEATKRGAARSWVTQDGYTQLPDGMRDDLCIGGSGANVWFLKDAGRWGAWTAAELDQMFGLPGSTPEK